jgi:hypothetical protein
VPFLQEVRHEQARPRPRHRPARAVRAGGRARHPTPGHQLSGDSGSHLLFGVFVATDSAHVPQPTYPISAHCEIRINGVSQGSTFGGFGPGGGVTVVLEPFVFYAAETDVVEVCDHVTVDGETFVTCHGTSFVTLPDVVGAVVAVLDTVVATLNDLVFEPTDPVTCGVLLALAPTVNALPPDVAHVDADGDLHRGGTLLGPDPNDLIWDCPPYRPTTP